MTQAAAEILTIGHSTLPYERFLALAREAGVTAIADVRSTPFSRHFPHFNRDVLQDALRRDGIAYVHLGGELGGRPSRPAFFSDGTADYEKMARSPDFARGLARVLDGSKTYRIALMCSEHDPLDCHRCLLVGRALHERGTSVRHILGTGTLRPHAEIEEELLKMSGKGHSDLFDGPAARLATAYRIRAKKVSFSEESAATESEA